MPAELRTDSRDPRFIGTTPLPTLSPTMHGYHHNLQDTVSAIVQRLLLYWEASQAEVIEEFKRFLESVTANLAAQLEASSAALQFELPEETGTALQEVWPEIEEEVIVQMPPREKYTIRARLRFTGKPKPNIIVDPILLTEEPGEE